jgi:hypothetical protein
VNERQNFENISRWRGSNSNATIVKSSQIRLVSDVRSRNSVATTHICFYILGLTIVEQLSLLRIRVEPIDNKQLMHFVEVNYRILPITSSVIVFTCYNSCNICTRRRR